MVIIAWDESLELGIEEVDEQHKTLLFLLGDAYEAATEGASVERIETLLAALNTYAREHFAMEERFMRESEHAGFERHRTAHQGFIEQIDRFSDAGGVDGRAAQIFTFLARWLREHIMCMDREFWPAAAERRSGE